MCCAVLLVSVTFEKKTKKIPQKNMSAAESDTNQNVHSEVLGTDDSGTVK